MSDWSYDSRDIVFAEIKGRCFRVDRIDAVYSKPANRGAQTFVLTSSGQEVTVSATVEDVFVAIQKAVRKANA